MFSIVKFVTYLYDKKMEIVKNLQNLYVEIVSNNSYNNMFHWSYSKTSRKIENQMTKKHGLQYMETKFYRMF